MPTLPLFQVDAFTSEPFRGNPAAVCLLPSPRPEGWMQSLAAEMNLSETAFPVPRPGGGYDLRWFTPAAEVALCGHATLATAHVLWETGKLAPEAEARFHCASGELVCRRTSDGAVEMDFPALPPSPAEPPAGLVEALGVAGGADGVRGVARSRFDYLVELADEAAVRELRPDFARLVGVESRGVIVTAPAAGDGDLVSRFFAPRVGVPEDPVTGSAHCVLAPFWSARLGRATLVARQLSARGGVVRLRVAGAGNEDVAAGRVRLGGHAVTVLAGSLLV